MTARDVMQRAVRRAIWWALGIDWHRDRLVLRVLSEAPENPETCATRVTSDWINQTLDSVSRALLRAPEGEPSSPLESE